MGALGDIIMSTSLIRSLIQHHATDDIYLLTSPGYTGIFHDWPKLKVQGLPKRGFYSTVRTISWIRHHGFRRLYDLQSSERTAIVCALSGVPERAGNFPGFPYHYHPPDLYTGQCHAHDRLSQVLSSAGISPGRNSPCLPVTAASKAKVNHWLENVGLANTDFVLMHAGASSKHPVKIWPHFLSLACELEKRGLHTVWLGGPDDIKINSWLAARSGIDTTGLFTIPEEAELGRYAKFAITNDSAPMHILSCSGIPVFGLFGPTNWRRSHALGQKQHVIAVDMADEDTHKNFVPTDIGAISVTMVIDRLAATGLI